MTCPEQPDYAQRQDFCDQRAVGVWQVPAAAVRRWSLILAASESNPRLQIVCDDRFSQPTVDFL
jgi:hypothetical protein